MRNAHPFNLQSYKNFANLPHPVTFFKKSSQRNTQGQREYSLESLK